MKRRLARYLLTVLGCLLPGGQVFAVDISPASEDTVIQFINSLSTRALERKIAETEAELEDLASLSLLSGVGSIGFRSMPGPEEKRREWIQIDFEGEYTVNQIVLVPTIWRDGEKGFIADGFPKRFQVLLIHSNEKEPTVVAEFGKKSPYEAHIFPLIIDIPGTQATAIKIEATHLSARNFDGGYTFQLSEIMVFSEFTDIALRKPVTTSSSQGALRAWRQENANDGFLPYIMDSAVGTRSLAYLHGAERDQIGNHLITFDLEEPHLISQVVFHSVEQSDTVPQGFAGDHGFPRYMEVEVSHVPSFDPKTTVVELRANNLSDVAPIVVRNFEPIEARYVRLKVVEPYSVMVDEFPNGINEVFRIGFAEVEILSGGKNVALKKQIEINFEPSGMDRDISTLNDGKNLYGEVLPIKDWLMQLSKRHELELQLKHGQDRILRIYDQQKVVNQGLWLALIILAVGALGLFLYNRHARRVALYSARERIAADLHDELGANMHALSLLGELAKSNKEDPEQLDEFLDKIAHIGKRSSKAVQNFTHLLNARDLYFDLKGAIRRNANRILSDIDFNLTMSGEEYLDRLKPGKKLDFLLFYKECLINIIRHSGATQVSILLEGNQNEVKLRVEDNGTGFKDPATGPLPESLRRRNRLMKGKASAENAASGGAVISLSLQP